MKGRKNERNETTNFINYNYLKVKMRKKQLMMISILYKFAYTVHRTYIYMKNVVYYKEKKKIIFIVYIPVL